MYTNIMFDLDGTVTDSGRAIVASATYALAQFGITDQPLAKLQTFIGPSLFDSFQREYQMNDSDAERAVSLYRDIYERELMYDVDIYEGIPELLKQLKQGGRTVFLVTSKPLTFATRIIEKIGLAPWFDHIIGPQLTDHSSDKKRLIEQAIDTYGLDRAACVMIGDTSYDIRGAADAGIDSIAVTYGYGDLEEMKQSGATHIAGTAADVAAILMNEPQNDFIEKLYKENLWVTDRHYELLNRLAAENHLTDSELEALVEQHSPKAKAEFAKSFRGIGNQIDYFDIPARIFPIGESVELVIRCKYRHQRLAGTFLAVISPYYDYDFRSTWNYQPCTVTVEADGDAIRIPCRFDHEDKYTINIGYLLDEKAIPFLSADVYALEPDLYECSFYKADLHMHTTYSDGYEPPELTAVSARGYGMDIIAVTDHNNFYGSVAAREKVREMGLDMTVLTGEEYSLAYSPMHILALGTDEPIERKYITREVFDLPETKQILAEKRELACDPEVYAGTQALLARVAEMGGIAILAHPYWKPIQPDGSRIDTPENVFVELGKDRRFAGIELVSGSREHQFHVSNLQASLARTILGTFDSFPIIGITDSHRYATDDISGKHFTVIFTRSREEQDVLDALRSGRCVPVDLTGGIPLCFGEHRLVKLADFLVRNYFPERDETARAEAQAAKEKYLLCN